MGKYNFDEIIDRHNTHSLKFDFATERGRTEDMLSLWVADMDFRTAPAITESLKAAVSHGIFGYSETKREYFNIVHDWYKNNFGWDTEEEWLIKTPGVVFALAMAVKAFTKEGDGVLIQQPVYYPFSEVIIDNGRRLLNSPLKQVEGPDGGIRYEMDFEDLENKLQNDEIHLMLLCSPHNPVGRVWTRAEMERLGGLAERYGVIIVSDEIHSDFTYEGHKHTVLASVSEDLKRRSIICTAPTKTFNLAGLQISNIFIPDEGLRNAFKHEVAAAGYSQVGLPGIVACEAAYTEGREWLSELKEYIAGNLDFMREFLQTRIPEVKLVEPEGTYLVWVDFSGLGLDRRELESLIRDKAKLWLDSGAIFGRDGTGFQRFNIACPRGYLEQALVSLENAIKSDIG